MNPFAALAEQPRGEPLLLCRDPDQQELTAAVEVARKTGLPLVCRSLINTNEFAFIP